MGADIRDLGESFWPIKMLIPEANSYKKSALAYMNAVNGTKRDSCPITQVRGEKSKNGY